MIIPDENERDLADIPKNIKQELDIYPVKWIDQALEIALQHMPEPLKSDESQAKDSEAIVGSGGKGPRKGRGIHTH